MKSDSQVIPCKTSIHSICSYMNDLFFYYFSAYNSRSRKCKATTFRICYDLCSINMTDLKRSYIKNVFKCAESVPPIAVT